MITFTIRKPDVSQLQRYISAAVNASMRPALDEFSEYVKGTINESISGQHSRDNAMKWRYAPYYHRKSTNEDVPIWGGIPRLRMGRAKYDPIGRRLRAGTRLADETRASRAGRASGNVLGKKKTGHSARYSIGSRMFDSPTARALATQTAFTNNSVSIGARFNENPKAYHMANKGVWTPLATDSDVLKAIWNKHITALLGTRAPRRGTIVRAGAYLRTYF